MFGQVFGFGHVIRGGLGPGKLLLPDPPRRRACGSGSRSFPGPKPSGAVAMALGNPDGVLNSLVVFAMRVGTCPPREGLPPALGKRAEDDCANACLLPKPNPA